MMKNKILCLLALLLSTITCVDNIFAIGQSVAINKMSSFKNLPPKNLPLQSNIKPIPLDRYGALIKKLNEIMRDNGTGTFLIEDFTKEGKAIAQAALYDWGKFLGVREYHHSNDTNGNGNVFSIDYSWLNIARIAKDLAERNAESILNETFHRTKYAVKCINNAQKKEEYQKIAIEEIKKNQDTLKALLEKITEVKINHEDRSKVTFTKDKINEFIDLCVGEDAVFDITKLKAEDRKHFRDRLEEMLQNYSGFQRICSIMAMRLINTIISGGMRGVSIEVGVGNKFYVAENKIYLTSNVLSSKYFCNYYGKISDATSVIYHEMTHFFHGMISTAAFEFNDDFDDSFRSMVTYNICNSKQPLLDLFFPALSSGKMATIVGEIKKKLEKGYTKEEIFNIYRVVVQSGFGNLLFGDKEIEKLNFENLVDLECLAKAIYIASSCLNPASPMTDKVTPTVWTDADEMLTIIGIVPLLVDGDKTYMLEDRQNEEVYNIREEKKKKEFRSNKDIEKFRYHAAYAHTRLRERINGCLEKLSAAGLSPNEVEGIDEKQFPEHLPFSPFYPEKLVCDNKANNNILEQCNKDSLTYIDSIDKKAKTDFLTWIINSSSFDSIEFFLSGEKFSNFICDNKIDLMSFIKKGNLGMAYFILSECNRNLTQMECEDIFKRGPRDLVKEIAGDVELDIYGANTNIGRDTSDRTLLHMAVERGYIDIVNRLLEKKDIIVDVVDKGNRTPLYYAAATGQIAVVEALLARGANANIVSELYKKAPLHVAVDRGCVDVVKALLLYKKDVKVDVDAVDKDNRTPLHYATEKGSVAIAKALLSGGAKANIGSKFCKRTPLHEAASGGYVDVVKALLLYKKDGIVDVDVVDGNNRTPLHYAAEKGHIAVVEVLLSGGAKANIGDKHSNRTPLHEAASRGYVYVVNALLLYKKDGIVDVDAVDEYNRTPLHEAARGGYVDIVNALLKAGADTGITSNDKNTPLDEAVDYFWIRLYGRDNKTKMKAAENFIAIHKAITEFHEKNKKSELPVFSHGDEVGKALSNANKLLAKDAVEGSAETKK